MKQLLLFSLFFFSINSSNAQKLRLISSTCQTWAGGQCCSSGVNYRIILEVDDTVSLFKIDTIWIDKQSFSKGSIRPISIAETKLNGKRYFTIEASRLWNNKNAFDIELESEKTEVTPCHKGKACVVYYLGDKKLIQEIKEFKQLQSIAYP